MRRLWIAFLLALLTLTSGVLAQDDSDDDTTTPTELTEELELTDGNTIAYPEGWFASEQDGYIVVSSDESMMELYINGEAAERVDSGQLLMSIQVIPITSVDNLTLLEIANVMADDLEETVETEFDINGIEAASISGVAEDSGGIPIGGYILTLDESDNGYIVLTVALTAFGEEQEIANIVNAITASLYGDVVSVVDDNAPDLSGIEPPELDAQLIFGDGMTLNYPEDWEVREQDGIAVLVSDPYLMDLLESGMDPEEVEPGQVLLTVQVTPNEPMSAQDLTTFAQSIAINIGSDRANVKEFELAGNQAISISGEVVESDLTTGVYVLLINNTEYDTVIAMFTITAPDEQDIIGVTVQAIAETLVFPD